MFDLTDPYKLVNQIRKYKIDDIVASYCYLCIKDAYDLYQEYIIDFKIKEGLYINDLECGLWHFWFYDETRVWNVYFIDGLRQWFFGEDGFWSYSK
jgi:hypothetical protein